MIILIFAGASIRLDTTLVDFNEMKWERGDITFLYKGDATQSKDSFFILDNKLGVYQRVSTTLLGRRVGSLVSQPPSDLEDGGSNPAQGGKQYFF